MKTFGVCVLIIMLALITVRSAMADGNDWSLRDTKGELFKLSNAKGSPVLLIFWATWCIPCKKEMNDNKSLFNSYDSKGAPVMLIAEDTPRTDEKVKPYVESKGFKQRVLFDPDGEILKRYGGTSLPFSVLLDKEGNVVQVNRGAIKGKEIAALTSKIDQLLGAGQ
jgi:peroxiredoxin